MTGPRLGLDVNVDELVLEGFPPNDRDDLIAGVQRGLARALAEGGFTSEAVSRHVTAALDAGQFDMSNLTSAQTIGENAGEVAAKSIHSIALTRR